jgi:hypothetical protein
MSAMTIPQDAPRSEDGYYWWDGTQWQPLPAEGASTDRTPSAENARPGGPQEGEGGGEGAVDQTQPEVTLGAEPGSQVPAPEVEGES